MTKEQRDRMVLNTSLSADAPTQLLALDVRAARKRLHLTTAIMASQIGISESALRRIENGTSHKMRSDTSLAILAWAGNRGYQHFGGFRIAPKADTPKTVAVKARAARAVGDLFGELYGCSKGDSSLVSERVTFPQSSRKPTLKDLEG